MKTAAGVQTESDLPEGWEGGKQTVEELLASNQEDHLLGCHEKRPATHYQATPVVLQYLASGSGSGEGQSATEGGSRPLLTCLTQNRLVNFPPFIWLREPLKAAVFP